MLTLTLQPLSLPQSRLKLGSMPKRHFALRTVACGRRTAVYGQAVCDVCMYLVLRHTVVTFSLASLLTCPLAMLACHLPLTGHSLYHNDNNDVDDNNMRYLQHTYTHTYLHIVIMLSCCTNTYIYRCADDSLDGIAFPFEPHFMNRISCLFGCLFVCLLPYCCCCLRFHLTLSCCSNVARFMNIVSAGKATFTLCYRQIAICL